MVFNKKKAYEKKNNFAATNAGNCGKQFQLKLVSFFSSSGLLILPPPPPTIMDPLRSAIAMEPLLSELVTVVCEEDMTVTTKGRSQGFNLPGMVLIW